MKRTYSYLSFVVYLIFLCNRCHNARINEKADRGTWYTERWSDIYLKDAHRRLQKQFKGFDLTIEDVFTMQQLCPYEVSPITPLQYDNL